MDEDNYITERVDGQIQWYDRKSQAAQRWFKRLRGFEIVAAAAIPILAGFASGYYQVNLLVALLGGLIAISSAFLSLNRFQENWTEYRTTCESLKHEKYLYLTRSAPYHEENAFILFVQRVESLISRENSAWFEHTQAGIDNAKTD